MCSWLLGGQGGNMVAYVVEKNVMSGNYSWWDTLLTVVFLRSINKKYLV